MPATLGLTLNGTPHRVHPFALTQSRGGVTSQAKSVLRGGAVLKNQPVSQPARLARKVQRQSGIVQGTTRGGARMNLTARQDGGYYYRQLRAIDELRLTTVTPGDRVKYEQAFARLRATDKLKKGQTPPPPGTLFSSHPYVGLHPAAEFGASQATQVRQVLQARFTQTDRHGFSPIHAQAIARDPNDHRGPEALRKPIPDDGGNKAIGTVRQPDGFSMARVLQHPKRATPGTTQWNREYKAARS